MAVRKFVGISIATFVGGSRAVVDLYVRLSEEHYVKVVSAGQDFDLQRVSNYQNREVSSLFVKREDYGAFAQQSTKIAEIVAKSQVHVRQKMAVLIRTAEHVFTQIADLGVDQNSFNNAVHIQYCVMNIVESNPDILDVIDELSKYSEDFVRHSMATSILAAMMVQSLRWHGKKTMSNACLGGLLHDLGMRDLPQELLKKTRTEMTPEELELFESHPLKSLMMLKEIPGMPPEILAIVAEHHELPSGAGFPRRVKGDKIYQLSRAVAFADNLADLIIRTDANPNPKDLKDAVKFMYHTMKHDFPDIYFEAAQRLIATEVERKLAA